MKRWIKHIIFFLFFAFVNIEVNAQQFAQSSMFMFNPYLFNPAVAGSKECFDFKMGYRQQWAGFDGAPESGYFTLNKTIKSKVKSAYAGRHAWGINAQREEHGLYASSLLMPSYAYHKRISEQFTLSGGLALGIRQFRFYAIRASTMQANDPVLEEAVSNVTTFPQASAGLWLYSDDVYFGLSANQIFGGNKKQIIGDKQLGLESKLNRHYYATVGGRVWYYERFSFISAALVKYVHGSRITADVNFLLDYANTFAIGVGTRNTNAAVGVVRFKLFRMLDIGYSYDFTTSTLRNASSNSHEIYIGIYTCPSKAYEKNGLIFCPVF